MNKLLTLTVLLSLTLFFSSCKKEQEESIQSALDNAQIETEFSYIYDAVADILSTSDRTNKVAEELLPNGASVTFTDTTFTDGDGVDCFIDYGALSNGSGLQGILCSDGRYRAGKIHIGISSRWSDFPNTITIAIPASNQYYVGNGTKMYKLTGTIVVQRSASVTATITITDGTLQRDNGSISWEAEHTLTLTTPGAAGWLNSEYTLSGSGSGTNANGVAFNSQIVTALDKKITNDCMNTFKAGELKITNSDGTVYTVNYGSQACDNTVLVTVNGNSKEVTLW